ncbi:MAG TPA: hypothetical protein VHM16_07695 [Rubrobacteraceae bacterium]|nr:hypothetical protein [Rubrobacteraceae bacterium]
MKPSPALTTAAHLAPPALALVLGALWLGYASGWGATPVPVGAIVLAGAAILLGLLAGALAGRASGAAERRAAREEREEWVGKLDHDLRGPMTVIHGEVELVLGRSDAPEAERRRSGETVVGELEKMEGLIRRRRAGSGDK